MKLAVEQADILAQALPYVQRYHKKIIVIKYGGNAMFDELSKKSFMRDIVLLSEIGVKVVLVHGGGPDIDFMLEKLGKEIKFIDGMRYTDAETMQVVQMVLTGKTNKELVAMITSAGAKGVGISGMDSGLITVEPYKKDGSLGYVGRIIEIKKELIMTLLESGYIPVIATVGVDERQQAYNVNADLAASAIAASLNAENMILISNIPGLLEDKEDEKSLISTVRLSDIPLLKDNGVISGGMLPKVECCEAAVKSGVKKACIVDGRIEHSLLIEMLSDEGIGTMFVED